MKELSREMQDWPVVIIATTTALKKMNTSLRQCFLHQVEIEVCNVPVEIYLYLQKIVILRYL